MAKINITQRITKMVKGTKEIELNLVEYDGTSHISASPSPNGTLQLLQTEFQTIDQ